MKTTEKKSVFVAVVKFAGGKLESEQAYLALDLAAKVGSYAERAEENARYLARKFAEYADDCADGRVSSCTPAGGSSLLELVSDAAKFEAYKEAFFTAFHAAFGKSFSAVRAEMAEAEKAVVSS
jgi:hypothetical protein